VVLHHNVQTHLTLIMNHCTKTLAAFLPSQTQERVAGKLNTPPGFSQTSLWKHATLQHAEGEQACGARRQQAAAGGSKRLYAESYWGRLQPRCGRRAARNHLERASLPFRVSTLARLVSSHFPSVLRPRARAAHYHYRQASSQYG
jgi:hypothetical protein